MLLYMVNSVAVSVPLYRFLIIMFTQGATFGEVIEMTDIFEGSIIRLVRRLDEFLNQVRVAYATPYQHLLSPFADTCHLGHSYGPQRTSLTVTLYMLVKNMEIFIL